MTVLAHKVHQAAGTQGEPALRPVPPQVALLPQVALGMGTQTHTHTHNDMLTLKQSSRLFQLGG